MPISPDALTRRVLECVPARSYAMDALLRLFRVEVTEAVPSASVSCERRPVLRVNPSFVERHCASDAHLFVLVMHELHHVLLGHTRLFPRPTPARNLAFDAVINALLCQRFPQQAYTSFFLDYYGGETGPLRLLAPPKAARLRPEWLAHLHERLYGEGATAQEVFEAISKTLGVGGRGGARHGCAFDPHKLLGSHAGAEAQEWGTEGPADRSVVEAIRRIVEKWPPPEQPVRGRSLQDVLRPESVQRVSVASRVLQAARRALLGAAVQGRGQNGWGARPVPALLPIPDLRDRRVAVAQAAGGQPLLYTSLLNSRAPQARDQARVYLDVSGSMHPYLALLYSALTALRAHIVPELHLFSGRVATVPLSALLAGRCSTTGGTDLVCVLEHALERRHRRLLLVTDGYVGRAEPALADKCRRAGLELRVLLTPEGWRQDVQGLAARIEELPPLAGGRS